MVVFGGLWDVAVAIFVVLVLAKYANVQVKKGLPMVTGAGLLVVLAAGSQLITVADSAVAGVSGGLTALFSVIAWILLLIGVLVGALDQVKK